MGPLGHQVNFAVESTSLLAVDFKANDAIREILPASTLYRKLFPFCKIF